VGVVAGLFVLACAASGRAEPAGAPGDPSRTSNELELGLGVERSVIRAPVAPVARVSWLHRAGSVVSLGVLFESALRPSPYDGFKDSRPAHKLGPALRVHAADAPVSAFFQTALGRAFYDYPSRHDGCSYEDLLFFHLSAGGRARVSRSFSVGGSATLALEGAAGECSDNSSYDPTRGPTVQGNPKPGTPRVVLLAHATAHF
jgi:hypothetical protein